MNNVVEGVSTKNLHHLIEEISVKAVAIFTAAAVEALKGNDRMGLELAKILVEDAIRYDSIYPRTRDGYDGVLLDIVKTLGNRDAFQDSDR